jgi:hypothetical protein
VAFSWPFAAVKERAAKIPAEIREIVREREEGTITSSLF